MLVKHFVAGCLIGLELRIGSIIKGQANSTRQELSRNTPIMNKIKYRSAKFV